MVLVDQEIQGSLKWLRCVDACGPRPVLLRGPIPWSKPLLPRPGVSCASTTHLWIPWLDTIVQRGVPGAVIGFHQVNFCTLDVANTHGIAVIIAAATHLFGISHRDKVKGRVASAVHLGKVHGVSQAFTHPIHLHVLLLLEIAIRAAVAEVGSTLHPHVHRVAQGVQGARGRVVRLVHAGRDHVILSEILQNQLSTALAWVVGPQHFLRVPQQLRRSGHQVPSREARIGHAQQQSGDQRDGAPVRFLGEIS
mmetsp:Transcript_9617/g.16658  ORF Transcript_9617/g.16658 Transcript_9617/m.16658 type:complete len:251 (-) Transcript_9617:67-819(-)